MNKDEPVAWGMKGEDGLILDVICPDEHERVEGDYTIPLYTTPQQRTWVGLNKKEVNAIYAKIEEKVSKHWNDGGTTMMFPETLYEAFEAKLKDKNT